MKLSVSVDNGTKTDDLILDVDLDLLFKRIIALHPGKNLDTMMQTKEK